jgi:MFS family permease
LLDRYQDASADTLLLVCATIFMGSAVFGVIDIALFHRVPHAKRPKPRQPILRQLFHPLRNRRFIWFSACTAILWFAVAGQGVFVTKYLVEQLQISSTEVQLIVLVVPLLAQLVVLPVWGRAIDRFGKKPAMLVAVLGIVPVGIGWCLMNSGQVWLGYALSCLGAVFWTGIEIANFNLVLELSGTDPDQETEKRGGGSMYMAMNAVIVNFAGMAGGLFYGAIAESLTHFRYDLGVAWLAPIRFYEVLFAVSAVLRLTAFIPLLLVHEPEARPTVDLVRFMAGNMYNNVIGAVLLPVRLVRRRGRDEGLAT